MKWIKVPSVFSKDKNRIDRYRWRLIVVIGGSIVLSLLFLIVYSLTSQNALERSNLEIPQISTEQVKALGAGEFQLTLTEKEVNYFLRQQQTTNESDFIIEDIWFETENQKMIIQASYKGFPLPLIAHTIIRLSDAGIYLDFDKISWGIWELPLPVSKSTVIEALTKEGLDSYEGEEFLIPRILQFKRIIYGEEKVEIVFGINHSVLDQLLEELLNDYETEILLLYSQSQDEEEQLLYHIFNEQAFTESDMDSFINSYLSTDKLLFRDLLVLLTDEMIEKIYEEYNIYLEDIPKEDIYEMKAELFAKQRSNSGKILLEALSTYENYRMSDTFFHAGATPFDLENDQLVTVNYLRTLYELPVSEDFVENARFIYDQESQIFKVGYDLNDYQKLVFDENGYDILSKEEYEAQFSFYPMGEKVLLTKDNEERQLMEDVFEAYFNTDKVFIRYLASDGISAFAVVSDVYEYQTFTSFVLKKQEGQWQVLTTDIASYHELNEAYKDFNIQVVPKELPNTSLLTRLSYNDRLQIIENLYEKGLIENQDYAQLEYCSYMDKFIAIKLVDGREFVFEVSFGFLEEVYTKEEAKERFSTIPEIILLQE